MKLCTFFIVAIALFATPGCLDSESMPPPESEEKAGRTEGNDGNQEEEIAAPAASEWPEAKDTSPEGTDTATVGAPLLQDTALSATPRRPEEPATPTDKDTAPEEDTDAREGELLDGGIVDLGISKDPVVLLVVFDKSGSMSAYWDGDTKWMAASKALKGAIEVNLDRVTVGAILFPMMSDCEVREITGDGQIYFMPGAEFITAWDSAAGANGPDGATPLVQAFGVADRAIQMASEEGLLDQTLKVFVLTDGEPNCDVRFDTITDYPEKWLGQGIETYVFGLPGSASAADVLDRIAEAGGTGLHFSSNPEDTPEDLEDNFVACI
jgi:hypothetical protein